MDIYTPINGITVNKENDCWHCIVSSFSDELKAIIRNNLSSVCYGLNAVQSDEQYYTYRKTLTSVIERYKPKSKSTKIGMLGELLAHILISENVTRLRRATLYLNKEEKSIKKGFDAIFFDPEDKIAWYTEMKAGESGKKATTRKNQQLLNFAKTDLKKKLEKKSDTYWDNALYDVAFALPKHIQNNFKKLLQEHAPSRRISNPYLANMFLISIVFGNCNDKINFHTLRRFRERTAKNGLTTMVFSIQKNTYKRIEEFLFLEIDGKHNKS